MADKPKTPKEKPLTPKQEKACRNFIKTSDKSAAYRFAYNTSKMKSATINRKAFELFSLGKIGARVAELRVNLSERNDITEDRVLKEYAKLGFLDPRKFYNEEGDLIPIHELSADVAAAITGMNVQTIYTEDGDMMGDLKKIKFADKKGALDSVAKCLGMFIERHEHTGKDGMELFPKLTEAEQAILDNISRPKKK